MSPKKKTQIQKLNMRILKLKQRRRKHQLGLLKKPGNAQGLVEFEFLTLEIAKLEDLREQLRIAE